VRVVRVAGCFFPMLAEEVIGEGNWRGEKKSLSSGGKEQRREEEREDGRHNERMGAGTVKDSLLSYGLTKESRLILRTVPAASI
jgi:hypothetical protein